MSETLSNYPAHFNCLKLSEAVFISPEIVWKEGEICAYVREDGAVRQLPGGIGVVKSQSEQLVIHHTVWVAGGDSTHSLLVPRITS